MVERPVFGGSPGFDACAVYFVKPVLLQRRFWCNIIEIVPVVRFAADVDVRIISIAVFTHIFSFPKRNGRDDFRIYHRRKPVKQDGVI